MSKIKKYVLTTEFLTSDIQPESSLLRNINRKCLKDIVLYKKNIFFEVNDIDILLLKKNNIVFYPYNIKFIEKKGSKIRIPVFIKDPSLVSILLKTKKINFKEIQVDNIEENLTEKEREYYYQEKTFLNLLVKNK